MTMTVEDRLLLEALCTKIARETDNRKFGELVRELIKLLERCRQKPQNPLDSRPSRRWVPALDG